MPVRVLVAVDDWGGDNSESVVDVADDDEEGGGDQHGVLMVEL